MKKYFFASILSLATLAVLVAPSVSFAANDGYTQLNNALEQAGQSGFGQDAATAKSVGLGGLVGSYVTAFLGFVGTIAFVVFLYGGFLWLTARGNDDQVADAKKYLFNGSVGIAIIVLAYSAAFFITNQLYNAASGKR